MLKILKQIQRRTPLGLLQLFREKGRLLVAISGIAFADILMFMQLGFQGALYTSNTRLHTKIEADLIMISPQARYLVRMSSFPRRRLFQAMDIPGVISADAMYLNFADWKNPDNQKLTSILVIGINPNRSPLNIPEVQANISELKIPDTVFFDRDTKGEYQKTIAQLDSGKPVKTEIDQRTITISGLYKIGASFAADGSIITSDQNYLMLFPKKPAESVNLGLIKLAPGVNPKETALILKATLPDDIKILTLEEFIQFEKDYWQKNTAVGFIFSLGVMMGFVVGVIIVYQILVTDVNTHIQEYATLKAMGYRHSYFLLVILEEVIILAILGFLPSLAVTAGLYHLTRLATNLPIYMTLSRAIFVLILTIIMCGVSGAITTRKLQAADPADIF